MISLDFYESGVGETIVVTFPGGKDVGIIDAHPPRNTNRPSLLDLVRGKRIRFVCLTHPHADHGKDLVGLVESESPIDSFWHTLPQVDLFFYGVKEYVNFPGPHMDVVKEMHEKWAAFLIDLFGGVIQRKIGVNQLCNDRRPTEISGVKFHTLSPDQDIQNEFIRGYQDLVNGKKKIIPDANLLSAILVLEYNGTVILLGGDALKRNWDLAIKHYKQLNLDLASVLKVPHHGATNTIPNGTGGVKTKGTYFCICSKNPKVVAIVFPGDSAHPHKDVRNLLRHCSNAHYVGASSDSVESNPLNVNILGARVACKETYGASCVKVILDGSGNITVQEA